MKSKWAALVLAATACVLWSVPAQTAPQPSEVPIDWELEFQFKPLRAMEIHIPGEPSPRLFWYLCYQVTNRTGQDRIFIPDFVLYTQTGQTIRAEQKVPVFVFDQMKKMLNDPFLTDTSGMIGKLLQGEDNAKSGLAIWPDFDPEAGNISIFVGGLSGETVEIPLPKPVRVTKMSAAGETKQVEVDKLVLSKTLQLSYSVPGEAKGRLHAPVNLVEEKWIMR